MCGCFDWTRCNYTWKSAKFIAPHRTMLHSPPHTVSGGRRFFFCFVFNSSSLSICVFVFIVLLTREYTELFHSRRDGCQRPRHDRLHLLLLLLHVHDSSIPQSVYRVPASPYVASHNYSPTRHYTANHRAQLIDLSRANYTSFPSLHSRRLNIIHNRFQSIAIAVAKASPVNCKQNLTRYFADESFIWLAGQTTRR